MVAALPVNADTWTVVGTEALVGTAWDPTDTSHDMTQVPGTTLWKFTRTGVTLEATGTETPGAEKYRFKVAKDHKWDTAYPASDKVLAVDAAGTYDVTFWYNTSDNSVYATYVYSIRGDFWENWDVNNDMTQDPTNENLYTFVVNEFDAVVKEYNYKLTANHKWGDYEIPSGGANNKWNCTQAGKYKLTFTANVAEGTLEVNAEKLPDYIVDFNTAIATSSHDFKVAKGWGHIVGTNNYDGYGPYYMSYSYKQTDGVGGTGTLLASRQYAGDYGGGSVCQDILITPAVNGTVTLDIMASTSAGNSNNAFVEVYAINVDGSLGDLLKTIKEEIPGYNTGSSTSWATYELANLASEQKIGLRCQYVYIDNFTATSANIPVERTLTVTKVANLNGETGYSGTTNFEQQPDGSLKVQLQVTLSNTGDVNFNPGDDGYTLTLVRGTTEYPDAAVAITEAIAAGEEKTIDVDFYVPYTSGWANWYVKENISGTTSSSYRYAGAIAYEPNFVFRKAGTTSTSSITSAEAWGTITESTTKNYEIANTGTAPLIINSIAIPEGFTTDATGTDVVLFRTSGYNADGAVWYAWTWNDGEEGTWVAETDGKFTGLRQKVNFIRMNPTGAPNWDNEWNRTGDLTVEAGKTYVVDSWGDTYDEKHYVNGHWAAAVVAKGETKAINITNDASVKGTFAGDLVIKHLDKDAAEQTYTLGFSTTVIGANTWTADFNNSTSTVAYPAGSIAEAGIDRDYQYISSGNYNNWLIGRNTSSYASENNKFITPKLHATAGDKLAFDVKAGYSGSDAYFVKVYVSTDRKTWGEPVETYVYSNTGSTFTTKTVSFDAAGDYYVAFALYGNGSGIDNLVGLEKVDVAHDLYIKSVTWPDASINSGAAQTKPSVDIIPLTTETADAYTVKYVCGETVLAEGTPVALTASANSSKTFSFNWTPNVESNTVYENTKVVFDFGGGVTFETETFDLTVTNEPKFHFVKTLPSNKWYEPTDYTTPITFGKTNTADTQKFYVNNWGTAPLTVKSIVMPEGFTVTPAEQFVVNAYDQTNEGIAAASQAVNITFSATEPGTYSGDMVITYVDGADADQTFVLAVSGTKLDPAKWYANFGSESGQWPAGSTYQSNVSTTYVASGDYAITSSSTPNNLFVTPKLAAAAGDKLMFDAKLYNSYYGPQTEGKVVVYAAATREEVLNTEEGTTRVQLFSVSGEDAENPMTTDYQTFQVPAVEGENYYAFEISGRPYVDEIYGLTPVAIAHDWMVASSNIPTEAMQNVAKNASVNVLNLGIADEAEDSYEVNLYIGGEKTATVTKTPALAMTHQLSAAGTPITVPMKSPKAGTFPVYIEVKAGDYSIATKPVNVTFSEEAPSTGDIEIGTKGTNSSYSYAIIDFQNFEQARTSDILYTATQLSKFGLNSGDKIQKLTFKGTVSYVKDMGQSALTSWVGLSTGDITYGSPDKGSMTEVPVFAAGKMAFTAGENLITINLPSPIVWDGTSDLRIYFEGGGDNKWITMNFYYDTNYQNMKWSNNSSMKYNPILYVGLVPEEPKTFSGTVKDNLNNPIENATVTLVSTDGKNIQYAGLTNENGEYSINVVQTSREYDVTASAYGYDDGNDVDISFADNVVKHFVLTRKANVSVTVTSAEWATITTPATYAVSFDENTEVYIATAEEGNSIKLTKIDDAPAMTPIVIHAAAGAYTMTQKATAASDVSANILKSAKGNEVGDGNGNYYVLGMQNAGVGFGPLADGVTLAKGKAYLVPTSGSGFLTFVIGDEDETTTINAVDAAGMDDDTPVYNLAGQKVGKDYKGVVIVNGRKVVRK